MAQEFIYLYEVRYITFGMDAPATKYYVREENAQKFYNEITDGDQYRADPPRRKRVKMEFVCYTRPDAIEDEDEATAQKIYNYMRERW